MAFEFRIAKWAKIVTGFRVKRRDTRAFLKYNSIKKLQNLLLMKLQMQQRRIAPTAFPFILTVDPINACNLKCPLCPTGVGAPGRPQGKMALDQFKKIIDKLGDYLYEVNLFRYGEPLLNKDIFQMVEYAHQHNIFTCINTNFNILSREMARDLVSSGLDYLVLSIDGLSPETYSRYRVGGDFNQVIQNIKMLVEEKRRLQTSSPLIEWQFLVFKYNQHEADKVEQFARTLGMDVTSIKCGNIGVAKESGDYSSEFVLEGDERNRYEKVGMPGGGTICDWLWNTFTVNYDGGVSPCCLAYKKEDDFGNFFAEGFEEIRNNTKFKTARSIFREVHLADDEHILCNSCSIATEYIKCRAKGTNR